MNTTEIVVLALIVLALIAATVALYMRRRTTQHLRSRFGSEYRRAVEESGPQQAEVQLQAREKRVHDYGLRPLGAGEREGFGAEWRRIQARFVDNPQDAASQADVLLGQVMSARGYREGDFDRRLEDLSVDHAPSVQNYRSANDVVLRHARGEANTEEMRQAMIHYRALLDELVGAPEPTRMPAAS